jgi:16S rRNA processing protein RimM
MEYITIGVIVNTHGLKGTLKVKSFTDFKEQRYQKGNTLYIAFQREYIPVTVDQYRTVKSLDYIDLKEFHNINEVEKYKGSELVMKADQKHELQEDEFYFDELVGMEVYTDQLIGTVTAVREVPQGELLVLKRPNNKDVLIPFRKEFVKEVNKQEAKITLLFWEGLL